MIPRLRAPFLGGVRSCADILERGSCWGVKSPTDEPFMLKICLSLLRMRAGDIGARVGLGTPRVVLGGSSGSSCLDSS
jgi:hypothetical protein